MRPVVRPRALGTVAALLVLALPALAPRAAAQQIPVGPAVSFTAQAVQVQGMTPGGIVVWFGIGRDVVEYSAIQSQRQQTTVADTQGTAVLAVANGVPAQSVWVAVDLKTGAYAQGSPAGFAAGRYELGGGALGLGSGALPDQLLDRSDFVHLLLVRPGKGAWALTVGRGGADDESSPGDASLRVSFGKLEPLVPGVAAPAKLNAKDLLFVAHPRTMELGILTIG
jgi:hypothetical protein